ncbi:MAG: hypothetical protein ABI675_14340 [Chitinophagaceae bacterium]
MAKNLQKWIAAQRKYRLSDKHIQMARELGLNPDKFGKLSNHHQEQWKATLPDFIESIYFKQFKGNSPLTIKSPAEILATKQKRRQKRISQKESQ